MDLSVLMHMIKFLSYKIIDVNIMGGLRVSNTSSANDVISFIRGTESLQQEIVCARGKIYLNMKMYEEF